jgi:regulator of nucleoside diphosphate kinase
MLDVEPCVLTSKDHAILEVILNRCLDRDDPLRAMLKMKVMDARVTLLDDIPADVVTLNSRVTFRVGDQPVDTRVLIHQEVYGIVGMTIPISAMRGLAMLGMSVGQSVTYSRTDENTETITVLAIRYQPEAARRERSRGATAQRDISLQRPARVGSVKSLLSTCNEIDDLGPSAD